MYKRVIVQVLLVAIATIGVPLGVSLSAATPAASAAPVGHVSHALAPAGKTVLTARVQQGTPGEPQICVGAGCGWLYAGAFNSQISCLIRGYTGKFFGEWSEYQCVYSPYENAWILWIR